MTPSGFRGSITLTLKFVDMATTLPGVDTQCCTTCTDPINVNVPGPQGPAAEPCTPCTNGINAFSTIVGGASVIPAFGDSVTIELAEPAGSLWVGQQQIVFLQTYGYYEVVAIPDNTHITVQNLGYDGNVDGDGILTFAAGTRVSPGGKSGTTGASPGGAFLIANNLSEGDPPTMRANLGLGTAATSDAGDFFAVANNLSEGIAATMRTNLGLGSAAVVNTGVTNGTLPPIDTTFTNGNVVFATVSGLQTKSASDALAALGLTGGIVGAYALLQNQKSSGSASGAWFNNTWVVVPVNTEVSDAGNIVSLAANVFTLGTGVYRIRAKVLGYLVDQFQARLFNISDAAVEFYGTSADANQTDNASGVSFVEGRLTVASGPKNYRLEAFGTTTNATDGFGRATGILGTTEVFCELVIEKEV